MEKVIVSSDKRETKEIKLPASGITVVLYASLLLGELTDINMNKVQDGDIGYIAKLISKMIKSWNAYSGDDDEKPIEINEKTVGEVLQSGDLEALTETIVDFQKSEKKS